MASPVADRYETSTGAPLAGGKSYWPAWRREMAKHTWTNVGNTLASIDPEDDPVINPNYPANAPWHAAGGQPTAVTAWNGAVWDEARKRLWVPLCGGHADYAGNETYVWDALTGQFSMEIPPTGAIGNTGTLNDGQEASGVYFDGQRWKVREAVSLDRAMSAITSARSTGSIGAKHMRGLIGEEPTVEADVIQINSDGTERQPYTAAY